MPRPARPRHASLPTPTGELALIERIRSRAALNSAAMRGSPAVRLGIGDDCAILRPPPGCELLVTTDLSLEGRHFRRETHSAASIGHRALARGLSDLAAMGARPLAAFLSLAMPRSLVTEQRFVDELIDGLLDLAAQHRVPLAGGDTSEAPSDHLAIDIVLLGSAPAGKALRRSGARPGDLLYVTGALGGAAAELATVLSATKPCAPPLSVVERVASEMWTSTEPHAANHPHLYPQPRLAVGQALLRRNLATACIDVSDGLSTDLNHLCTASSAAAGLQVAAELDAALLPAHPLTKALDDRARITAILHGGEDYELLFTARPSTKVPRSIAGVPITRIGRILSRKKSASTMSILTGGTRFDLQPHGWEHLQ